MRALAVIVNILLVLTGIRQSSEASQVTLAWDPSADPDVVGYNVYYGTSSQHYSSQVPAGSTTSVTVSNLAAGSTYYFAATTVNSAGLESDYSSEVTCSVAGACAVNLSNLAQVYDGTPKSVTVCTTPAGLAATVTYNGSTNSPVAAGNYQVVAAVSTAGYLGSVTNFLTIAKAPAVVQLTNLNQTYDGTSKNAFATTTPPGLTLSLTFPGLTSAPVNAGGYPVVAIVVDPNYSGGDSNVLSISKANASVQLANLAQTYDGTSKTVSFSTVPAGLPVNLTFNGLTALPLNAGSYQVQSTVADPNYQGSSAAILTISKAPATIQLGNFNQTYDGTPKTISFSTMPAGLPVNLTFNGLTALPLNAGSYQVQSTVADPNYQGSSATILTISKAAATIQLANLNQTYDGMPKTVTATTLPPGLAVLLTYNGRTQAPSKPGSFTVVGTVADANFTGGATNLLTITKAKIHPAAPFSVAATEALPNVQVAAAPTGHHSLILTWPPTPDLVSISHSFDLVAWTTLTNLPGGAGLLELPVQADSQFFKAIRSGPGGTQPVALGIGR